MLTKHKKLRIKRRNKYKYLSNKYNNQSIKSSRFKKLAKYEKRKRYIYNSKNHYKPKSKPSQGIIFDAKIDFKDNINGIISINKQVNDFVKVFTPKGIRIDHSKLEKVSIGALVYIVAQISRINKLSNKGLKYNKKLGINNKKEDLAYLFYKIGYWNYFGITRKPKIQNKVEDRLFLKVRSSNDDKIEFLNEIKKFVSNQTGIFKNNYRLEYFFDDVLKEAMGNTLEHAYIDSFNKSGIKNLGKEKLKWWVCGYYSKNEKNLVLIFYDYGVGIRESAKYNAGKKVDNTFKERILNFIDKKTDAELINMAINKDLSKYKKYFKRDRGKGLKSFQNFAKECGYDSELMVISGNGRYIFTYDSKNLKENINTSIIKYNIDGMFIKWKLQL